ncbi:peptidylprolyl isomerase [Novosphingobium sp.]|uniref:peptidylprolyl isomerase n=1 Tax=Novosphingobium sp. TaxID=1874826 RepID=UPI00286E9998|nr:peptidylprolyl isomerase [Novosphingobium sp.]
MQKTLTALTLALIAAAPIGAQDKPAAPLAPSEIVAAAPKTDWTAIAPSDLLVMDIAPDAKGRPRRVVIQLMPPPFSQGWIGNIRKLAAARFWDGTSVNRVQDNYVVQWGDATEKKALPAGLATVPESEYLVSDPRRFPFRVEVDNESVHDSYADYAMPIMGWPVAFFEDGVWPVHCYGMVGVGRNLSPDTGTGAELYTVIGHAPRHLDRNIAVVGRVIEGIEHLSSLPRGTEALGFYRTAKERTKIRSVRLGNEVTGLPGYEFLSTESGSFAAYADARANRRDAFFIRPAGGADVCNIPVPVRRVSVK